MTAATDPFFSRLARNADRFATACAIKAAAFTVARASNMPVDELLTPPDETRAVPEREAASGQFLPSDPDPRVLARREMFYLAITLFNRPQRSVARVAGISQPAIKKGIGAIEIRRDDPRYDRRLDELELALMGDA